MLVCGYVIDSDVLVCGDVIDSDVLVCGDVIDSDVLVCGDVMLISVKPTCVLNGKTGDNILPEFTNFYTNVFKPNTVDSNNKFRIELDSLLSTHMHSRTYSVPRIDIADLTT